MYADGQKELTLVSSEPLQVAVGLHDAKGGPNSSVEDPQTVAEDNNEIKEMFDVQQDSLCKEVSF